ncbi:conserved exported hypothetical protein [Candidatus Sulfopaludibacter sp. SbA3]|nr:conserved exported hypothetical protein [Candidatus Sulfopaludibacter sp. SbA3]
MSGMRFHTPILILAAGLGALPAAAETTLLDRGYQQMYDLQFSQAHDTFHTFEQDHPEDPMGPVSDAAACLFSEFDRMHILQSEFFVHEQHFFTDHKLSPDPQLKRRFDADLEAARRLAGRAPANADAQFARLLATGLESDYMALIEKRYAASFQQMKAGRVMAEQLLSAHPQYYDAWIAVGVENYMLSVKPAPVRWLLRLAGGETDRALGIEKLRLTASKGHYLAPFARLLLAVASLRTGDSREAKDILAGLCKEYPHNPLYAQELARLRTTTGIAR